MELKIARHGQTEWNIANIMQGHLDSPLTLIGQQQASQIGSSFSQSFDDSKFDLIICSDLGRTRHTLLNIFKSLSTEQLNNYKSKGLKVLFCKYAREGSGGIFETQPISQLNQFIYEKSEEVENPDEITEMQSGMRSARPEGGESVNDTYSRVCRIFRFCANVSILKETPQSSKFSKNSLNYTFYPKFIDDESDTFAYVITFSSIEQLEALCSPSYPHFDVLPEELSSMVQKCTEIDCLNILNLSEDRSFTKVLVVSHGGFKREIINVVNVKEQGGSFSNGFVVKNCSISTLKISKKQGVSLSLQAGNEDLGEVLEDGLFVYELVELNNVDHLV